MALQEVTNAVIRRLRLTEQPMSKVWSQQCRRYASSPSDALTKETAQLETSSFAANLPDASQYEYDPAGNARKRQKQLPRSRYGAPSPQTYHGNGQRH